MADKTRNPRNSGSPLFKKLTRLFSGPLTNYRHQLPRRLRRRYIDGKKFTSATGQQFKKSEYNPFSNILANMMANQGRAERYVDFEQMEYMPEIASSMDIYADEMTTSTGIQPLLRIHCKNDEIKTVLNNLYGNILNVEFNLFGWCRTMCKFGDFFLYMDIDDKIGIKNVIGLPGPEVERLEGEDKTNPNYVQFQWNAGGITFENWQVAHFRILGNDKYAPYGTSVLEPARRIWRQLTLLEDAMMAYRIVRSPERRVFYIDVGNIAPDDVEQYMQKVMNQMKSNQVVDQNSGRVDLRYNPMSIDEDYFVPVRGDSSSSRIETLPGGTYTGDIDDVKYLRDKLFAALKVPASYLSRAEGAEEDKATLAQKDIRFARTIQRLQRAVVSELEKIGIIHLYILGFRGEDLLNFNLVLNNPSKIGELQELEHWRTKFDVASAAVEGFFSRRWVAEKLFGMSEEEFVRNQREMFYDRKFEAALEVVAGQAMAEGAGGGGPPGAGAPPGAPPGPPPLPPEDAAAAAAGPPGAPVGDEGAGGEEGGEEDVLLAAPPEGGGEEGPVAKRDDKNWYYKTRDGDTLQHSPGAKGNWYRPVDDDARSMGARRRSMKASGGGHKASPSKQNVYPGYQEIDSLTGLKGLYEEKDTNYSEEQLEENEIFKVNYEVRQLIKELESKDDKVETQ